MNVTTKLKIDLSKPDFGLSVDAVQGDAYSRSVSIALYNGILPWHIPENVAVAVRYAKPDCTKGYYDTLPDGESAWSYQGNVLTVQLAPQMLTVAGQVKAQIELIRSTHILSTFSLTVHVEANPAAGVLNSEDYSNWLQWILEQSDEHAQQVHLSAQTASQASEIASLAAENAADSANHANAAAQDALEAAVSANMSQIEASSIAENVSAIVAGNEAYTKQESNSRYSSRILQSETARTILLSDSAAVPLQNLRIWGKTKKIGTPTPDAPVPLESVGDGGSVTTTVCGKNLVNVFTEDMNRRRDGTQNTKDPNVINEDGSITINIRGADTYGVGFIHSLSANKPLTISFDVLTFGTATGLSFVIYDVNNYVSARVSHKISELGAFFYSFTPSADSRYLFGWYASGGTAPCGAIIDNLQLEYGETVTEYESYKDGGAVTVTSNNGLPGIPVSSGGNYTDGYGQHWICDEVDFAKGVYVQRVNQVVLDGDESVGVESVTVSGITYKRIWHKVADADLNYRWNVLSDHFFTSNAVAYSAGMITADQYLVLYLSADMQNFDTAQAKQWLSENPVTVQYILATPIEIPLSAEQLTAYASLHTNYPTTTIFNDGGADMEVQYVADTKLYIDNKFNKLAAILVNNA